MRQICVICILCNLCVFHAWSQLDAQFSQYFTAINYYNPSFAGKTGELNIMALHRIQWLGFENAPQSSFVTADMPWKYKNIDQGIGIVAILDKKSSVYSNTNVLGQYTYKKKLGKGTLSIGLQAGLMSEKFDTDSIRLGPPEGSTDHETTDEIVPGSTVTGSGFDMGAGFLYHTDKYYIGLACAHLLGTKLELDENAEVKIDRSINLVGGYNIQTKNPLIELQPSLFVQTNLQMVSADITGRVVYNKMFNGGLGIRLSDNGRVNAGILYLGAIIKGFNVGYAYEFPISAISKGSIGGHELMATYQVKLKKGKGNRNKHKSVRIL